MIRKIEFLSKLPIARTRFSLYSEKLNSRETDLSRGMCALPMLVLLFSTIRRRTGCKRLLILLSFYSLTIYIRDRSAHIAQFEGCCNPNADVPGANTTADSDLFPCFSLFSVNWEPFAHGMLLCTCIVFIHKK